MVLMHNDKLLPDHDMFGHSKYSIADKSIAQYNDDHQLIAQALMIETKRDEEEDDRALEKLKNDLETPLLHIHFHLTQLRTGMEEVQQKGGLRVTNEGGGEVEKKSVRAVYLEEELHNIHSKWNEYLYKMRNSAQEFIKYLRYQADKGADSMTILFTDLTEDSMRKMLMLFGDDDGSWSRSLYKVATYQGALREEPLQLQPDGLTTLRQRWQLNSKATQLNFAGAGQAETSSHNSARAEAARLESEGKMSFDQDAKRQKQQRLQNRRKSTSGKINSSGQLLQEHHQNQLEQYNFVLSEFERRGIEFLLKIGEKPIFPIVNFALVAGIVALDTFAAVAICPKLLSARFVAE
ncbi:unnamed protein product, partial [Amoebophrya sp. A120]|eukprot:GSA120T00021943001.1